MKTELRDEINEIIHCLLSDGVAIQFSHAKIFNNTITWSGCDDISIALKDIPYHEKYSALLERNCYSIRFDDDAIAQLSYTVDDCDTKIIKHRLAYYPPSNQSYLNENEELFFYYETSYSRKLNKSEYTTPSSIRFDYAPNDHVPSFHPRSHMHLGEIENCRIPVSKALTPFEFMGFILRSFYSKRLDLPRKVHNIGIADELYNDEISQLHWNSIDAIKLLSSNVKTIRQSDSKIYFVISMDILAHSNIENAAISIAYKIDSEYQRIALRTIDEVQVRANIDEIAETITIGDSDSIDFQLATHMQTRINIYSCVNCDIIQQHGGIPLIFYSGSTIIYNLILAAPSECI